MEFYSPPAAASTSKQDSCFVCPGALRHPKVSGTLQCRQAGLQHVRIDPREGHQPIDVVNIYQFAWHHRKQDDRADYWRDCMARRLGFIQKLSAFLRGLPQRNVLCLLGDASTQLTTRSGVVGHGIPSTPGPQRDVQDLLDLLQAFSLTAVNTYGAAPGGTFCNPATQHESQIDYIFLEERAL